MFYDLQEADGIITADVEPDVGDGTPAEQPDQQTDPEVGPVPDNEGRQSNKLSPGVLAAIIASSLALLAVFVGLLLFLGIRRRNKDAKSQLLKEDIMSASNKASSNAALGPEHHDHNSNATWGKSYSGTEVRHLVFCPDQ